MARKKYGPEQIIAKLREADVLLSQGHAVGDVVKAIGVHEVTYYRWRKEYGGLKVTQVKRRTLHLRYARTMLQQFCNSKGCRARAATKPVPVRWKPWFLISFRLAGGGLIRAATVHSLVLNHQLSQ